MALPKKGSNSFYTFPAATAALLIHLSTSCHIGILTPRAFAFPPPRLFFFPSPIIHLSSKEGAGKAAWHQGGVSEQEDRRK